MEIRHQTHIAAPRSVVWRVTVDIERWPGWTPTVQRVRRLEDGPFAVGSAARIKQPGLPETTWRVTAITEGEGFTWETRLPGLRMVATHALEDSGTGTRCDLSVGCSGLLAVVLAPFIRMSVGKTLAQENAGLKLACETPGDATTDTDSGSVE